MDGTGRAATTTPPVKGLLVWHWNCNGFAHKKAVLQQHLQKVDRKPDVIMVQESNATETPKLAGYRSHNRPPDTCETPKGKGRGVCIFVRKGITFVEHEILEKSTIEHCTVEVITGRKRKESTFLVNVYSKPAHTQQKFKALFHKACRVAGGNMLMVCGDFNAANQVWGYRKTTAKGRDLLQDALDAGLSLVTDPEQPTRTGTSVSRDTTPDLTFVKVAGRKREVTWNNTGYDLGSDHYILEVLIPLEGKGGNTEKRKHRVTDWDAFRTALTSWQSEITDIDQWTDNVNRTMEGATKEIETDESIDRVDSRLAHLLEAKQSIKARWKGQRTNRKLRKKIAELNQCIEGHCRLLCEQQWTEVCNEADGQMNKSRTWSMLRHLLDETKTKGYQHDNLARILHKAISKEGEVEIKRRLDEKYLPSTPTTEHLEYQGTDNATLDKDIATWEVRAAMQKLNSRSAAGPDRVTNKAIKNLSEAAIENITKYYNKCWREGKLPKQWKTAKTILIPKPGKQPSVENLRPISLTSCVGKLLEHVLLDRWQRYLEESGLYPDSIIGFRNKLGTQDAMILLKNEIIDVPLSIGDNRAILGLDLQSAFDKVSHSAILAQVSKLNMGRRSYDYIRDFLTGRTTRICAGDLQLDEKDLGSVGTPQGSVISPLLFNLVMIGVANRLQEVRDVRHTIYADDITLWVKGGSDGHIENQLQEAVEAIEEHLEGSGLVCSPTKSELLVLPPKRAGRRRKDAPITVERPKITVKTAGGRIIPEVDKIRVLGLLLERNRVNGETITKLNTKVMSATKLLRRISNRKDGMKEESLITLVQSFAISHIAYVAAFHKWTTGERNKIDALIRKVYKIALGLPGNVSTQKLMELGVNNTLEEIAEAQRSAHLERLSGTKTGRKILQDLGINPNGSGSAATEPVPSSLMTGIRVCPIPRNMNPTHNAERRAARAGALVDRHAEDEGAVYVDAAEYQDRVEAYTAVVVSASTGAVKTAASTRTRDTHQAEEVAIALAIADPGCKTVLSDSRTAVLSYAKGRVCSAAARILRAAEEAGRQGAVVIKWFPAHMGNDVSGRGNTNHNETANAVARGLTNRATANVGPSEGGAWYSSKDRMTTYNEIAKWYRLSRRTMPPPHSGLKRGEAVIFRQLQTGSLLTPVLAKYIYPGLYADDTCRLCMKARATAVHVLWDCEKNPREATEKTTIPPQFEAAARSCDLETQRRAVQQISAALERQRADDSRGGKGTPGKPGGSPSRSRLAKGNARGRGVEGAR